MDETLSKFPEREYAVVRVSQEELRGRNGEGWSFKKKPSAA